MGAAEAPRYQRFACVIGYPLTHTLSPPIHNAAFRRLGIDCVYLAAPVAPEHLGEAIAGLRALGALGANVTMPHKEAVIAHLDDVSGDARAVGAVNTIQALDKLIGHNTDVDGFRELLVSDIGYDARGARAVVLGAGGAARAVVCALDQMGAARIAIVARRAEAAGQLSLLAGASAAEAHPWEEAAALCSAADVVVNATPLGTGGGDPVPGATFRRGQVVVDLVYDPPATELVRRARAAGADAWGGLGMLIHQAAASFKIWTGQEPPIEVMSAAALHALRARTRP
jgi:shikimate dehydrogenase